MDYFSKDFHLQVVTPIVIRGPDQSANAEPELRTPAIKALMRWWFRAVTGGKVQSLETLRELESLVFGSTSRGSPINIFSETNLQSIHTPLLPHHPHGRDVVRRGLFEANRGYINISMNTTRPVTQALWDVAIASLELAVGLGGFGTRCRRGYGAMKFAGNNIESVDSWETQMTELISTSLTRFDGYINAHLTLPLSTSPKSYPTISQQARIQLGEDTFTTYLDSLTGLMDSMHALRANDPNSARWLGFVGGGGNRQASPLWIKPVKIGEEFRLQYVVIASDFSAADYPALDAFLATDCARALKITGWNQ